MNNLQLTHIYSFCTMSPGTRHALARDVYTLNFRTSKHPFKLTEYFWCAAWDSDFHFALQSSAAQRGDAVTLLSPPLTEDIKRRRYEDQVKTDQKSLLHAHFLILECNFSHAFTVVVHGSYLFWCFGCLVFFFRFINIWKTGRKGIWMAWEV